MNFLQRVYWGFQKPRWTICFLAFSILLGAKELRCNGEGISGEIDTLVLLWNVGCLRTRYQAAAVIFQTSQEHYSSESMMVLPFVGAGNDSSFGWLGKQNLLLKKLLPVRRRLDVDSNWVEWPLYHGAICHFDNYDACFLNFVNNAVRTIEVSWSAIGVISYNNVAFLHGFLNFFWNLIESISTNTFRCYIFASWQHLLTVNCLQGSSSRAPQLQRSTAKAGAAKCQISWATWKVNKWWNKNIFTGIEKLSLSVTRVLSKYVKVRSSWEWQRIKAHHNITNPNHEAFTLENYTLPNTNKWLSCKSLS